MIMKMYVDDDGAWKTKRRSIGEREREHKGDNITAAHDGCLRLAKPALSINRTHSSCCFSTAHTHTQKVHLFMFITFSWFARAKLQKHISENFNPTHYVASGLLWITQKCLLCASCAPRPDKPPPPSALYVIETFSTVCSVHCKIQN